MPEKEKQKAKAPLEKAGSKSKRILTKQELDSQGAKKAPSVKTKKRVLKEIENVEVKFECPFAPLGKSKISFLHTYEDEQIKYELDLDNKIYTLPSDLKKEDKKRYRKALRDNGFMDVTKINAHVIYDDKKKKYIYMAMHPEHTERNPVNGPIALVLKNDDGMPMYYEKGPNKGKQIIEQVNIINGKVKTDNPMIYEALLEGGFYSAGKIEKEDK